MRFSTLAEWLQWLERLHPTEIDLGLERVSRVYQAMGIGQPYVAVAVAGTNGKGSCVAMLQAILGAAGYRVGAYTSPHLLRYNERVRIDAAEVGDDALCHAFARIDAARGETSLTYFEFGTLAALDIFDRSDLDVGLLEVGMGGRLDAVNVIEPDVALVTSIAIDHADWLGGDREAIGREKAGILRPHTPAVCSDPEPPASLLARAREIDADMKILGRDFGYENRDNSWDWRGPVRALGGLPMPRLQGPVQLRNAAGVLMVLEELAGRLPVSEREIRRGLGDVELPGRFQVLPGPVEEVLDVAHNPEAARFLATALAARPVSGPTRAVLAMLDDKDVAGVVGPMRALVDGWHVAGLAVPRGLGGEELAARMAEAGIAGARVYPDVAAARRDALAAAGPGGRVVVFGSFHTVAEALAQRV